jgi:hypothetical protein
MKVVLSNGPLFNLTQYALGYLWEHHREFFDEPIEPQDVILAGVPGSVEEQFAKRFTWAVLRDGFAWFLDLSNTKVRGLPWLIERVERGDEAENRLRIVGIDEGRDWYLYCEDDGGEWVVYKDRPFDAQA